jgi:uncharacterized integral membrane protein
VTSVSKPPQQQQPYGEKGRKIDARLVVAVVVVVLLVAFIFQNRASTEIHWLFFTFSAPLWVVLAISIVLAALVGYVLGRRGRGARTDRR